MKYDPNNATILDKTFVATMLKTITSDPKVAEGMPESVYNYLKYTIETVVNNINAEITLDIIKTMASTEDEEDE